MRIASGDGNNAESSTAKSIFNFSAGPAMLPEPVMLRVQQELRNWQSCGVSVMEISHRSRAFSEVAEQAEHDLRELLAIPSDYHVLFLHGGATHQFAMVPLNLLGTATSANYCNTGIWSQKAIDEAKHYADVQEVCRLENKDGIFAIPDEATWSYRKDAAYLHYTPNETIGGVEFAYVPKTSLPLVADMSSTLLSRPIDVTQFALIYASAQKNIGPPGLTVVIVRDDMLQRALPFTPTLLRYQTHAEHHSLYHTPPTFAWYVAGCVFQWIKEQGGLAAMAVINQRKASKLYAAIDDNAFYHNPIHLSCRSWMNVPFRLRNASLEETFLNEAKQHGLVALEGHRSVGGLRASIYNAMPEAGVDALTSFMQDFARRYG